MQIGNEGLLAVKAQLAQRIDQLEAGKIHRSPGDMARIADDIRSTAARHGLNPLADVAHGLETALARSGTAAMISGWIEGLRDALDCDAVDAATGEALLASIGLRQNR